MGRSESPLLAADLEEQVLGWLLDGDPAMTWQVMRDLSGSSQQNIDRERRRVATEGWGARLLGEQDEDGLWAGALYSPKWTSTTYTLLLLERLGVQHGHPKALAGCRVLWDNARFYDGGITFAKTIRQPETCITAMLVLLTSAFGFEENRLDDLVRWILGQQLPDGGWNCETVRCGSQHGSFHTSISVLEALLRYEQSGGEVPVSDALAAGREFFLDHQLYLSHRTGAEVDSAFVRFPFPPQWHFDIVRGLEHFRAADADPDERLGQAIAALRKSRRPDGTWPMFRPYEGRYWFRMEARGPSRWSTLRALTLLNWWEHGTIDVIRET